VMLADAFCRAGVVQEMRLGVVTSLCGGPFFLLLLLRNRSGATG
jgi:ABC-type Fe3+-siderophore transport system permease subunit